MSQADELQTLGFSRAGRYQSGQFQLDADWKPHKVVYVWTRNGDTEVLRVGIACGAKAFGTRYASYNRWLGGRFKPDDDAEQEKARLFRARLDDSCMVWARTVEDKSTALTQEADLRRHFGPILELDLMTPGWAKEQMTAWRASRRLLGAGTIDPTPQPKARNKNVAAVTKSAPALTPSLVESFHLIDSALAHLGFTRRETAQGWSYARHRGETVQIHPKPQKGCLRVGVGEANEIAAPPPLRDLNYRQRGWLVVSPPDAKLAHDYLLTLADAP